jgi:hypothetical protein
MKRGSVFIMMFEEFKNLAKNENITFEEFETIEKIYMVNDDMTKGETINLWKLSYGKQIKRNEKIKQDRIYSILNDIDTYWEDRKYFEYIRDIDIYMTNNRINVYIDNFGVKFFKKYNGIKTPNGCYWLYRMGIITDDNKFNDINYAGYDSGFYI